VRSSPVSGQYAGSGGSLVSDEVGSDGADSLGASSSSPPPQPARSSEAATSVATTALDEEG
jgi:hypothetical protein